MKAKPSIPPAPPTGDSDMDQLNKLLQTVDGHDDRGMVLSLAAFAEDTLGRLLTQYLREDKQAKELVEGFNAPLGTLSTRIKAAFALGLLAREQFDDLEILRRVRNSFAHDWQGVSLERDDIKALVGQLHGHTFDGKRVGIEPKQRLRESVSNILIELRVQIGQHRKYGRRAPFVGFRLYAGEPVQPKMVEAEEPK